ncbi:MAG TPA: hypothetical protein VF266_17325 [Thermoanaerobaculia bacterium]
MTWVLALFAAAFLAAMVYEWVQKPKREQAAREARERRASEVARRGWTLDVTTAHNSTIYVYSGTTGGVAWRCEMSSWTSRGRSSQQKVFTRWSTDAGSLPEGVFVIWPSFGAGDGKQIDASMPQFLLDLLLTPLIRALGADANTASLITNATPVASEDPAYLLRATDPDAMQRFLDRGAREALRDAAPWLPQRASEHHLVIAVAGRQGLAILLRGWVDDVDLIERVALVGSRLARAAS